MHWDAGGRDPQERAEGARREAADDLDVIYAKAPWTVIRRAMHIHPTVSELVPTILSELRPLD